MHERDELRDIDRADQHERDAVDFAHTLPRRSRQLQHDRLGELLADMESESGPIPDELMEEARQLWRGPAERGKQRRSA